MAAKHLKQVGMGQQKAEKVSGTEDKQLRNILQLISLFWQQVCDMTGYKKSTLERQSLSEAKMGRGSVICK